MNSYILGGTGKSYLLTLTKRGKSLFQKVESQYFKIRSNKRSKLMNICTKYKNKVDRPRTGSRMRKRQKHMPRSYEFNGLKSIAALKNHILALMADCRVASVIARGNLVYA